jgi:MFS family permease
MGNTSDSLHHARTFNSSYTGHEDASTALDRSKSVRCRTLDGAVIYTICGWPLRWICRFVYPILLHTVILPTKLNSHWRIKLLPTTYHEWGRVFRTTGKPFLLNLLHCVFFFWLTLHKALGYFADRIGPLNAFIISSASCGALISGWMGIGSAAGIIVFCILYGFFSSGLITLPAAVIASMLCPDMHQYGVRLTMQLVPAGIGLLIGNPIAGALLKGTWVGLQSFSAATVCACTIFSIAAKLKKPGQNILSRC